MADNNKEGGTGPASGTASDKTVFDQAQEAVTAAIATATDAMTAAFDNALEAAKENPRTAAAIVAGAAAAVAGAAFGVSKLLEDTKSASTSKSAPKKN